jgi:hypothetical protein
MANVIPCDAQFIANYTDTVLPKKSSATAQGTKSYSHAILVIVALAVDLFLL